MIEGIHRQFEQLPTASDAVKWINSALAAASSDNASLAEEETLLRSFYNESQMHSHRLSGEVEAHISQAATRLPRAALELSRMTTDTIELEAQMKAVHDLITPSGATDYTAALSSLRTTNRKLERCVKVVALARQVEARMRDLNALQVLSESNPQTTLSIIQLAESLSAVKGELEEVRSIEPDFGSHYNSTLAEYEQLIQDQLEEQCLKEFVAHNVPDASELFKSLYRIGRASAVLQRFYAHICQCIVSGCSASYGSDTVGAFLGAFCSIMDGAVSFFSDLGQHLTDALNAGGSSGQTRSERGFVEEAMQQLLSTMNTDVKPRISQKYEAAKSSEDFADCLRSICAHQFCQGLAAQELSEHVQAQLRLFLCEAISSENCLAAFVERVTSEFAAQWEASCAGEGEASVYMSHLPVGLVKCCDVLLEFFPEKSFSLTLPRVLGIVVERLSSFQAKGASDAQPLVLEALAVFVKGVQPGTIRTRTLFMSHLEEATAQSDSRAIILESSLKDFCEPLSLFVNSYIESCQSTVIGWIVQSLAGKAADYPLQPLWARGDEDGTSYQRGQASATQLIRDFGEAIIEIPVTLDSIRARSSAAATHKGWVDEVIEELSEVWLDAIVSAAVNDFVTHQVLPLRIRAMKLPTSARGGETPGLSSAPCVVAWGQLQTDVSYLRNVLEAVSDEKIGSLEDLYQRLHRVPLPSVSDFVVRDVLYSARQ